MKRRSILKIFPVIIFLNLLLTGCAPAPPIISGRKITKEQLKTLETKPIDKKDLLDLLGPPYAIFKPGSKVSVQRPPQWNSKTIARYEEVDSDTVYSFFSPEERHDNNNRIYYYYYSKSSQFAIILVFAAHEKTKNRIDELFVLVNERDGRVKDFFFNEGRN